MTNQIDPARLAELRKVAEQAHANNVGLIGGGWIIDDEHARKAFIAAADPALVLALLDAAAERDAYRKAKQENDERFMLERDEARAQLAAAQRALVALADAVHYVRDELALCSDQWTISAKRCLRDSTRAHRPAIRAAREAQP